MKGKQPTTNNQQPTSSPLDVRCSMFLNFNLPRAIWLDKFFGRVFGAGKSGGGPPHSRTLSRGTVRSANAERLGLRQPSGALGEANNSWQRDKWVKVSFGHRHCAGRVLGPGASFGA
jgi:hypothetical protein